MREHISKSRSASPAPRWDGAAGGRRAEPGRRAARRGELRGTRGVVRGTRGVVRGGAAIPFCRSCRAAAAVCVLFPLQVPRGLHPTHRVRGHLRDHSIPLGRLQRGKEAGDGATALTPPVWSPVTVRPSPPNPPAPPTPPPRQGISGPGAAHTTCGAPLPPGAALLNVWQRAPSNIFSPPLESWKTFCPLKRFAKGKNKKKKAKNGENQSGEPPPPRLSLSSPLRGEGRYLSLHFSHNLVNLSKATTL